MNTDFNNKLLKKYPIAWNLNTVWLVVIMLVVNLLYFIYGYFSFDDSDLFEGNVGMSGIHFTSVLLYILIGLLALVFFALKYFSFKPLSDLLPLKKFYFSKVLWQMVLIFFIYGMVLFSYEEGNKIAIKKNHTIESANSDFKIYQRARALLGIWELDEGDFHIKSRQYPKPFPLDNYNYIPDSLNINHKNISTQEELYEVEQEASVFAENKIDYSQPYVNLNGELYQFGTVEALQSVGGCDSATVLEDIQDVSHVYMLKEVSRVNYKLEEFGNIEVEDQVGFYKELHKAILNKDLYTITLYLKEYKDLLNRFSEDEDILLHFSPERMARFVLQSEYSNDPSKRLNELSDYDDSELHNTRSIFSGIEQAYLNMGYKSLSGESSSGILIICLFAALFFILAKSIPTRKFLISIVVIGILQSITSLFIASLAIAGDGLGYSHLIISMLSSIAVIGLFIYALNYSKNQKILDYGLLPTAVATPIFLVSIVEIISEWTARDYIDKCTGLVETEYLFSMNIIWFLLISLISIYFILYLLRKWRATPNMS